MSNIVIPRMNVELAKYRFWIKILMYKDILLSLLYLQWNTLFIFRLSLIFNNLQVQYCAGTSHRCSSVAGGSSDGDAECEIATLAALSFGEERYIDRVTSRNEPSPAWKAASSRTLCVIIATTVIVTRANKTCSSQHTPDAAVTRAKR